MPLDCPGAQEELCCDLGVRKTSACQPHDLLLLRSQLVAGLGAAFSKQKQKQKKVLESDSDSDIIEIDNPATAAVSGEPPIGWMYIGSHNFTPSAWGTLSGSAFTPVLNVRCFPSPFFLYCRA